MTAKGNEPQESLRISASSDAGISTLTVEGEIDLSNAEPFEARMVELIGETPPAVLIDMGRVSFIDASGLRVLFSVARLLRAAGRRMAVVAASTSVARRTLDLVNIDREIAVYDALSEAVEEIGRAS